jgi:pSer/pThr/pTyr-binding forkhead associated (FHA) protein
LTYNIENVPWIVIDSGEYDGKAFPLKSSSITIGRDTNAGIPIPIDQYISGVHAKIYQIGKQEQMYMLRDVKSRNHTIINDKTLADEEIEIRNGDRFKIGKTWLKFIIPSGNNE